MKIKKITKYSAMGMVAVSALPLTNCSKQMCSNYPMSDEVHTYAEYLRQAGYYCTNNSKTGSVLI
jgi:hypothetical protein